VPDDLPDTMAKDALLPCAFSKLHPRLRTPYLSAILTGIICPLVAGLFPFDLLGGRISIGTLMAFAVVCDPHWLSPAHHPRKQSPEEQGNSTNDEYSGPFHRLATEQSDLSLPVMGYPDTRTLCSPTCTTLHAQCSSKAQAGRWHVCRSNMPLPGQIRQVLSGGIVP
jgi:hypothetical protein